MAPGGSVESDLPGIISEGARLNQKLGGLEGKMIFEEKPPATGKRQTGPLERQFDGGWATHSPAVFCTLMSVGAVPCWSAWSRSHTIRHTKGSVGGPYARDRFPTLRKLFSALFVISIHDPRSSQCSSSVCVSKSTGDGLAFPSYKPASSVHSRLMLPGQV